MTILKNTIVVASAALLGLAASNANARARNPRFKEYAEAQTIYKPGLDPDKFSCFRVLDVKKGPRFTKASVYEQCAPKN